MKSECDSVAERVALGEELGELVEHASTCLRCQAVIEMPGRLGATHREVDPGLGFSARMTVGAQHRIAVRRRRRLAAGLATSVGAAAMAAFVMTRTPERPAPLQPAIQDPTKVEDEAPVELEDEDLEALVRLSDTSESSRLSANWTRIQKPLAPYRKLIKGVTP